MKKKVPLSRLTKVSHASNGVVTGAQTLSFVELGFPLKFRSDCAIQAHNLDRPKKAWNEKRRNENMVHVASGKGGVVIVQYT